MTGMDDLMSQCTRVADNLRKAAEQHLPKELVKAQYKVGETLERTMKFRMTIAETNPSVSYGKRQHHPSLAGESPAVDYGTLRNSITHSVDVEDGTVVARAGSTITNPNYGSYLETGTSRMRPRPWIRPSLDEDEEDIKSLLGEAVKDACD